jgi:hypothetical protein
MKLLPKETKESWILELWISFSFLSIYMNPVADEDCIKVYMEPIPRGQQKVASECSKSRRRWYPLWNNHHHNLQTPIWEERITPKTVLLLNDHYPPSSVSRSCTRHTTQLFQKIFNRKKGEKNTTNKYLKIAKSTPQTQPKKMNMWVKISKLQSPTHKAIYNSRLMEAYLRQLLLQATAQLSTCAW